MTRIDIYTDNAGGITLQTRKYCHHYQDPKQAADDALAILCDGNNTETWDGNEPEHRVTDSAGYRHTSAESLTDLRNAVCDLIGKGRAETEFAARVLGANTLRHSVEATCVHGTTGQDVSEDTLDTATLVKNLTPDDEADGQTTFLASTDGVSWYKYRTFDAVEVRS